MRYLIAAFLGGIVGFGGFILAGNMENFGFFRIRQWITGKTVMSEIIHHPADQWIIPVLELLFILIGTISGILFAKPFDRQIKARLKNGDRLLVSK